MRYFDTHFHLPTPDTAGLDAFLRFLESEPDLVGGNLILNTIHEVEFVESNLDRLPSKVVLIPYFESGVSHSESLLKSGWFKIHSNLQKLEINSIPELVSSLEIEKPKGLMVHCFPWGPEMRFNIGLALVIKLAQALPDTIVLVTHGGGYESWAFRSHVGGFKNVHFDFSLTLDYYERSDVLLPLQRYLRFSKSRVHFGSDWPSGNVKRQLDEMIRLAKGAGLNETDLESLLLENAQSCWLDA